MKKIIIIILLITSIFSNTNGFIEVFKGDNFIAPYHGFLIEDSFMNMISYKADNYDILKTNEIIYLTKISNREHKINLLERKIEMLNIDNKFIMSQNSFLTNQLITFKNELIDKPKIRLDITGKATLVTIGFASTFILGWVLNSKYNDWFDNFHFNYIIIKGNYHE